MSEDAGQQEPRRPLLRVVRGNPSDAELAALTAVVGALASAQPDGTNEREPRSHWAARDRVLRAPRHPGPGAWRSSGLPH